MDSTIAILALIVSVGAVIVGPLVSARVTRNEMLGQMRQQWINELRIQLSQILGNSSALRVLVKSKNKDENQKLNLATNLPTQLNQITLMLNPKETHHKELLDALNIISMKCISCSDKEYTEAYQQSLETSKIILKTEWEVVKGTKG